MSMRLRNLRKAVVWAIFVIVVLFPSAHSSRPAMAQGFMPSDPYSGRQIEAVEIQVVNPGPDNSLNERVTGNVRRLLGLLPDDSLSSERAGFALTQARRAGDVAKLDYEVQPSLPLWS
jgi:hypothetical protein